MIDQRRPELEFPVDCHFKVITEQIDGMAFVIETVLAGLGIESPVTPGNRSAAGRYITYNLTVRVESREQMNRIDAELRNIAGVKMVL